jgi:hypothetical protein
MKLQEWNMSILTNVAIWCPSYIWGMEGRHHIAIDQQKFKDGVDIGEKFSFSVEIYDIFGELLNSRKHFFAWDYYFHSSSQAPIPENFISLDGKYRYRHANNIITFQDLLFTRAAQGDYYLRVYVLYNNSTDRIIFSGPLLKILVKSKVNYVGIIKVFPKSNLSTPNSRCNSNTEPVLYDQTYDDEEDQYIIIEPEVNYCIVLVLAHSDGGLLKNEFVGFPNVYLDEYPPAMHALISKEFKDYFKLNQVVGSTDKNGLYYLGFAIKTGAVGAFFVSFDFGTGISIPNPFMTKFNIKSIEILDEPSFTKLKYDDPNKNAHYVGRVFDNKARVKIDVSEGLKSGYVIIAHPKPISNETVALDIIPNSIYDLDSNKN